MATSKIIPPRSSSSYNLFAPSANEVLTHGQVSLPEAFGKAIPSSPSELLQFIKKQQQNQQVGSRLALDHVVNNNGNIGQERIRKQEKEREDFENRMMETEDSLSDNLIIIFKEYDKFRLKEQVKLEVEARKAKELEEREARRKAAEDRRAAVVERLRIQAEREEQRKRDAELARIRIEEAAARQAAYEVDRLRADHEQICLEDQLSMLVEQDYREQADRLAWKQKEKERILLWEAEQKKKDEIEEEKRRLRLAELEEKRKKLEILRQEQAKQKNDGKSAASMKEEGDRINKQLRIQNKAKFVSKKIAAAAHVEEEQPPPGQGNALPSTDISSEPKQIQELQEVEKKDDELSQQKNAFAAQLRVIDSDSQLRVMLKDLMTEKRGLRLEQRQRSEGSVAESVSDELKKQLDFISFKHELVEKRLAEVEAKLNESSEATLAVEAAEADEVIAPLNRFSSNRDLKPMTRTMSRHISSRHLMGGEDVMPAAVATQEAISTHSKNKAEAEVELFRSIEVLIREVTKLLDKLQSETFESPQEADSLHQAIPGFLLDISRVEKNIPKDSDPLGYADKLQELDKKLKAAALMKTEVKSEPTIRPSSKLGERRASAPVFASEGSDKGEEIILVEPFNPNQLVSSISAPALSKNITTDHNSTEQSSIDQRAEEETIDPSTLRGWDECIYTSMFSAAHHAAFFGYNDVLQFLCKFFDCFIVDKKGRTPLFYAAVANRLECVATLLALDPQWIDVGDEKGDTPLHAAAISNGVEVLQFLLSCEATPDTANNQGLTASHLARSKQALIVLKDAGAQMYCIDNMSRMPLWFACSEGRADCVEFLCSVTPSEFILWKDEEGETCLHKAASSGHHQCVEVLCSVLPRMEDLYVLNKRNYTAAHVASTAAVLRVLYENGANLWFADEKGRMPLFMMSFFGRLECVALLLELGTRSATAVDTSASQKTSSSFKPSKDFNGLIHEGVLHKDKQGDTALHAACMCGHLPCVSLLLFFMRNATNKQQLRPSDIARKANHHSIAQLVEHIDGLKVNSSLKAEQVFSCDFITLVSVIAFYGSRWSKAYDHSFESCYYIDRITGLSQWERPESFDMPAADETRYDKALELLKRFYSKYNAEKLKDMNDILFMFRNKYSELFISLANKYALTDLSMFQGINLD